MKGDRKEGGGAKGTWFAHPALQKESKKQWSGNTLGSLLFGLSNGTMNVHVSSQNYIVNANSPSGAPDATEVEPLLDGTESKYVV